MVSGSTAVLPVSDILKTTQFYTEVLGFQSTWTWGDPPTFGGASWANANVMFCLDPELASNVEGHQHWFDAEDVDALHELHGSRGAEIVSPIEDKPWERREYTVRDLNGYRLRFAGQSSYTPKGIVGSDEGVTIERRLPTQEEYQRVASAAFYREGVADWVLEGTWAGVVAKDPSGSVIGTVRVMRDAPSWFSVWDVAVVPEWQNRRIGTKLMEEALEIVHEESPGAFVYLFTFKHGFYERLGFAKGSVQIRKV